MARLLLLLLAGACSSACLFSPALDEQGYLRCGTVDECAAGRGCVSGLCTPPPWNDVRFGSRQLVVVENTSSDQPLAAGAALPLRIGAGGILDTAALGVDGRMTFYSFAAGAWSAVPLWRDVYDDHLLLYAPVQEEVALGQRAQLGWIETQTGEREPGFQDDAAGVFPLLFEDFLGDALDDSRWESFGTGGAPDVQGGRVNVADNQQLVSTLGLTPPFSLTFKGRINGVNCDPLYLGFTSDVNSGLDPPSLGFFVQQGLVAQLEVGPNANSVPQQPPELDEVTLDTASHRYRLDVGSEKVRFVLDGEVVGEPAAIRFLGEELFFTVDVDGDCSFDLELVHAAALPIARPALQVEDVVQYQIFE